MDEPITVALAGNPNSGKTTVFNRLTGAHQHVGNYPGVTVEKKEGVCRWYGRTFHVVDLPGTYSLTANSLEELVARNYIIQQRPHVVIDIVDASNLERNLYLASQLIELDVPVIIALNMADLAEAQGKHIDTETLSKLLGVPVVRTVATKAEGMDDLLATAVKVVTEDLRPQVQIHYGRELEPHIEQLTEQVKASGRAGNLNPRWVAVKLLENDKQVLEQVIGDQDNGLLERVLATRIHIEQVVGDDAEIALADRRYGFITGACREAVTTDQDARLDWSDAIDTVVTSRLLGLPIFFLLLWLMFTLVFTLGAPPMEWIQAAFAWLSDQVHTLMPPGPLRSLLADGIIGGVGGVLTFVPNIFLLFMALALLEDSGYMARAAFVIDWVMHKIGLHGKSFIPLLIGFGCTVPAVMATRTLASRRDRIVTMLIAPLMSCGGRLPIYVLLAGAFFAPNVAGHVIFSIYLLGVIMAVIMARIFRSTILAGESEPFVMELPPYRIPTFRGIMVHTWERTWMYIRKAGTIILAFSVLMWFLLSYPKPPAASIQSLSPAEARTAALSYSLAGRMGNFIEPILRPLGFDWKIGVSLIAGFAAKETVVSTLGTLYSIGEESDSSTATLQSTLRRDPVFNPLVAYAMMVFVLLYVPCVAALAVIRQETGSWRWPAFVTFYTCTLAWIASFVVYQGGKLLGWGLY